MGWLKRLFKRTKSPNIDIPAPKPSKIDKIAIIVGHGSGDGGATCWNDISEFSYNSMVAEIVKTSDTGKKIDVFYRTKTGIFGVAARVVNWNPDISIELHLNAFNKIAFGCEVLCLGEDEQSAILGRSFAQAFSQKFKRKLRGDRGVKWLGNRDRGAASLAVCKPIKQSILVEPFFCDNKEEWIDPMNYSQFLVEWIKGL